MRADSLEGLSSLPVVPDVKPPIMGRGENVGILAVVLDLRRSGKPVTKS